MKLEDWVGIGVIMIVVGIVIFLSNPNSEHSIQFREFEKDCSNKGGTVVYTKETARNVKWFCAKEAI